MNRPSVDSEFMLRRLVESPDWPVIPELFARLEAEALECLRHGEGVDAAVRRIQALSTLRGALTAQAEAVGARDPFKEVK